MVTLDKRRLLSNGKYPVRLRVAMLTKPRKRKLYPLPFEFTEKEFENVWLSEPSSRKKPSESRIILQKIELDAIEAADKLPHFSFEAFEQIMFAGGRKAQKTINFYFQGAMDDFKDNDQWGTFESYRSSLKSLLSFSRKETVFFEEITPKWLQKYERWMLNAESRSRTTVGVYLRTLRAVFNRAIDAKAIHKDVYPFGKKKYEIPAPRKVKKALSMDELTTLWKAEPQTPEQQRAKDFWFLSYSCSGMNLKDIAYLKRGDIKGDSFVFSRKKTSLTDSDQKDITVFLNDFSLSIIERYGTQTTNPESYVFQILNEFDTPENDDRLIGNFVRSINQNIKKLAATVGVDENISYQWARHTWATQALNNSASIELIGESLGHSSIKTTQNYLAGFNAEIKKELAKKMMNF